jgi:phage head maturation protease
MSAVLDAVENHMFFRGELRTAEKTMRQALEEQAPTGEADILVAVFGVEDTEIPFGAQRRQTIERGAFRPWLASSPFPMRWLIDHGDAIVNRGVARLTHQIGRVDTGEEQDEGLLIRTRYNLSKQVAREAYSDLAFSPDLAQFSWGSDVSKEKVVTRSGRDYLVEAWPFEFSHVSEAAQQEARLVAVRAAAQRTAIGRHSTPTVAGSWDAAAQERAYTPPYARYYAWREAGGDADSKSTFKFPHHMESSGAANLTACSAGIGVLNGGRGGADIGGDRAAVYAHLAGHMRDGDREPPPLRAAEHAEFLDLLVSEDGKRLLGESLVGDREFAEDLRRAADRALEVPTDPTLDFYRSIFKSG